MTPIREHVLVTGASGFLGTHVARELLETTDCTLYALVRRAPGMTAAQRLQRLWWRDPVLKDELGKGEDGRVRVVEGDVSLPALGLDEADCRMLAQRVDGIVHAAALVGVNDTASSFRTVNVEGTRNVLDFARAAAQERSAQSGADDPSRAPHVVHVSTAYVAGTATGPIPEEFLPSASFNSLYEQSKHEAEGLVEKCCRQAGVPFTVLRPGQMVGHSLTGFAATFNTLYYPLKLYLKGQLRVMPARGSLKVNLVPVDYVAHLAVRALFADEARNQVIHALTPCEQQPTARELMEAVRLWARERMGVRLPRPLFLPVAGLAQAGRRRNLAVTDEAKPKSAWNNMLALAPYFGERRAFATERAQLLAERPCPAWQDYLPRLLEYAVAQGFLNHTGRTVFEQALVRLSSTRHPLAYFDRTPEGVTAHSSLSVREDIQRAARSLVGWGIEPGDRVAMVGVNSVRSFTLDAAVGLSGAASVPLYYTAPAQEVCGLVRKSGAKMLFAGTRALLDQLSALSVGVPVVSLLDEPCEHAVSWSAFLAHDQGQELPYVAPDSLATIRYTSGTTGEPKGVTFTQEQLQWMGSTMPALLDWRTRNRPIRYLSFLPMSHVVEGVLVAYAPYYLLTPTELHYLADFPSLAATLPAVRPTLFFSVPRFYEKVWNQLLATGAGRLFARLEDGPAKRLMAPVVRRVLLKKAGLGECRQLIVGSAPMSLQLMQQFRSLGVEVHNAYGVTEAPLVTLNRRGRNVLGSVGELLPETQVKLAEDGEVLVRGPQVTAHYHGAAQPALDAQGYFHTGDEGSLDEHGRLVLHGRKKELVITSYGKNISPQKVETRLKDIEGVSEAVLVGDGLPYCTALLWLENEDPAAFDSAQARALDQAVLAANQGLSHPEQVKRWAVMRAPLTISAGELTPNLKVRRTRVLETRAQAVSLLYAESAQDAQTSAGTGGDGSRNDVLHQGRTA